MLFNYISQVVYWELQNTFASYYEIYFKIMIKTKQYLNQKEETNHKKIFFIIIIEGKY